MNIKHILRKDGENDIKLRSRIKKEHQIADLSKTIKLLQEQLDIVKDGIDFVRDVLVENKDSDVLWDMVNGYLKATLDKIEEVK